MGNWAEKLDIQNAHEVDIFIKNNFMTGSYVFHFESCRNHSYYVLDSTINVTESHHHEFKTGGGSYPITILPEVKLRTNI